MRSRWSSTWSCTSEGLVTEWAQTDCVGLTVGLADSEGLLPAAAGRRLGGARRRPHRLPAMARIAQTLRESVSTLPLTIHAEVPDGPLRGLHRGSGRVAPRRAGTSELAAIVRGLEWPDGPGYFWMGGESAQMRDIRRHVRHDLGWDTRHYEVMGYWSGSRGRRTRRVDPGPIYAAGKAAGKSDEEIWADYDEARDPTRSRHERGQSAPGSPASSAAPTPASPR